MTVISYSCERQDQNNECNYSNKPYVVSETCNFTELNDTIWASGWPATDSTEYQLLFNNSSVRFVYYHVAFMASSVHAYYWKVNPIGNCEILVDTSLQIKKIYPDTFYVHVPMPLILRLNDTINTANNWSNSELVFTKQVAEVLSSPTRVKYTYIPGWNYQGEKYFAFRVFHGSDTTYGIFGLDLQSYKAYIKGWGLF